MNYRFSRYIRHFQRKFSHFWRQIRRFSIKISIIKKELGKGSTNHTALAMRMVTENFPFIKKILNHSPIYFRGVSGNPPVNFF